MEDYVTYEQAVKLKELGFDWECDHCYYGENATHIFSDERKKLCECFKRNSNSTGYRFSAPTLSQAQKWLREVKGIYLFVTMENSHYYWYIGEEFQIGSCESYEQALSAGIDKVLLY